jgi:hypothetical protein
MAWFRQLRATISAMTATTKKTSATVFAIVAALLALLVSYWTFRWGFIRFWEWQHEGRRMVFVFGPEINAAALAVLSSIAVFLVVFRHLLRKT